MNCKDVEANLADYLGDELDAAQRAAFEAHVGECTRCRDEVADLGGTIKSLRTLPGVSTEDARRHTADLIVIRRPSHVRRMVFTSLKAAAMIGFGMMLGWATFGQRGVSSSSPGSAATRPTTVEHVATGRGVHPAWYKRGRQASSAPSSFARHLAMIAPKRNR